MKREIDRDELGEIVAEVTRSAEREKELFDSEEVAEVLRELDLPAHGLDEARAAIARRREELAARRRRRLLFAAAAAVMTLAVALVAWIGHRRQQALAAVAVSHARLEGRAGQPLVLARRSEAPELTFTAALLHAPRGERLELACDWRDGSGAVRHQNAWETRPVDRDVWATHCRRRFGEADGAGRWSVTLRLGERALATGEFTLE